MPIHDWSKVPSGLFHDFHQSWSIRIKDELNKGRLPKGVSAFVEQKTGPREPDVLAIEELGFRGLPDSEDGALLTRARPATRIFRQTSDIYAHKANRIAIKHHLGKTIAIIELVSPGNKNSRSAFREFVDKTVSYMRSRVHVLIVDLFPPTKRDPGGIHQAIWSEFEDEVLEFPAGKNRTVVSYESGDSLSAYVEPLGIGDNLPEMPLFLYAGFHVVVPLESTYAAAWQASPEVLRQAVETGIIPDPDANET